MTCLELKKLLPSIAEREGTPRVAFEAARHLSHCTVCAGELLRLREMNGLLDRMPKAEVPASFPGRVLRALRAKGGLGLVLIALLALGGGGTAIPIGGAAGSILSVLAAPLEVASSIASALARTALALLATLQETMGGSWAIQVPFAESSRSIPSFVIFLVILGAAAFAGSWAAFGFGALRFRRELRGTDSSGI